MMHALNVIAGRMFLAGKNRVGFQRDNSHRQLPIAIFCERSDRIVNLRIDNEARTRRDIEKPQHMATRQRRYECFLGVNRRSF